MEPPAPAWSLTVSTLPSVQTGEDGMPRQKHAGPASTGSLHHRETWSILHWAVDRRICLPEPHQVRAFTTVLLFIMIISGNCASWRGKTTTWMRTTHSCVCDRDMKWTTPDCFMLLCMNIILLHFQQWLLLCACTITHLWQERLDQRRQSSVGVFNIYVSLFSDNKKGLIPSERTLNGRGSCWPNASRPPWPRLRLRAWSKTNAKARPTGRRVKRTMMTCLTHRLFATFLPSWVCTEVVSVPSQVVAGRVPRAGGNL